MRILRHSPLFDVAAALSCLLVCGCDQSTVGSPDQPEVSNHAPQIAVPALAVDHDEQYEETISVWDEDGDSVFVSAVALPHWLVFDSVALVLSGTPGPENVGDHQVGLVASDGKATTPLSFTVTVKVGISSLVFEGSWIARGFLFGHDGLPYESDNFTVYSGFSSGDERRYVAEVLEGRFVDLKTALHVSGHDEFQYPNGETPIDVLTLRLQGNDVLWTGQSYRYGLIVHAPDSPRYSEEGYTRELYGQLLTHELMHVIEYLLVGTELDYTAVEKWFHEGMATYVAGPPPNQIVSASQVQLWQSEKSSVQGQGNPVSVKTWSDFPTEIVNDAYELGRYYLYFELAVRYLVDSNGYGKSLADVKEMYLSIRRGMTFREAFEDRLGMTVDDYEANFFARMLEYLEQ